MGACVRSVSNKLCQRLYTTGTRAQVTPTPFVSKRVMTRLPPGGMGGGSLPPNVLAWQEPDTE